LPISRACFACGTDNELGLGARLEFDAEAVRATWQPRAPFRRADGTLAPAALTTLLDEAAFWLGALATGESGMTTELRVTLHASAPSDAPVTVSGARAVVRPRQDDPRYQETEIAARAGGRLVATARITFVVVRGAARRLVSGMLAINDPACVRRVFPAYTR
jgi:acyl-coenzyme A thioesterase PaaI-like protein